MDENKTPAPAETPEAPAPENAAEANRARAVSVMEWMHEFVLAFVIVMLLITLVARHSPVSGSSMYPTLHDADLLIISDLFYTPKNGDIIVFQSERTGYDEPYVKRIIATGGQTIDIDFETWTVTVDGEVLDEDYINYIEGAYMNGSFMTFPVTVPEGQMFVMGDNRNGSSDSRSYHVGFVDERFIIGHVILRLWPFNVFGTVQ